MQAGMRYFLGDVHKMLHIVTRNKRNSNQLPLNQNQPPKPKMNMDTGVCSIMGTLAFYPVDLAKTRLQTQQRFLYASRTYRGITDCLRKCYQLEGGLLSVYRGAPINLLLVGPEKSLKFSVYDKVRSVLRLRMRGPKEQLRLFTESLAGGAAGAAQVLVTTPMELLKIHQQDMGRILTIMQARGQDSSTFRLRNASTFELGIRILRREGLRGLYRGLLSTLFRDVIFSMLYFPIYSKFTQFICKNDATEAGPYRHVIDLFLSSLCASSISAVLVTPLDVIKSRLQVLSIRVKGEQQYTGFIDCYRRVMLIEGPKAFLRGAFCRTLIIAPLYALLQVAYEIEPLRSYLQEVKSRNKKGANDETAKNKQRCDTNYSKWSK